MELIIDNRYCLGELEECLIANGYKYTVTPDFTHINMDEEPRLIVSDIERVGLKNGS